LIFFLRTFPLADNFWFQIPIIIMVPHINQFKINNSISLIAWTCSRVFHSVDGGHHVKRIKNYLLQARADCEPTPAWLVPWPWTHELGSLQYISHSVFTRVYIPSPWHYLIGSPVALIHIANLSRVRFCKSLRWIEKPHCGANWSMGDEATNCPLILFFGIPRQETTPSDFCVIFFPFVGFWFLTRNLFSGSDYAQIFFGK
jgi:hypothetical protein